MKGRLPFEILPTASIVAAPYLEEKLRLEPVAKIQSVTSNKSSVPKEIRELDEEQGKRILALIYERNGSLEKKSSSQSDTGVKSKHQASFYINQSQKNDKVIEMNLLDKVCDHFAIESKGLLKLIDRELLVQNGITIEDLIGRCDIGITDLKAAGIVTNARDLSLLGFKMSDLVIKRERFQAQQLADLFQLNYDQLRRMKSVQFSVIDLIECKFYPYELVALSFSFDHMIRTRRIDAKQLKCLNFSLSDLISLQFSPDHLEMLHITERDALKEFKWDRKEYKAFIGI